MNQTQMIIAAGIGVFVAGFLLVGNSKQESDEFRENASMVRAVANLSTMANQKCPRLIKEKTGTQVYFPKNTESDKATYVTMFWEGGKDDNFKTAECTLHAALGGVSKLIIDGETVIDKDF